MTKSAISLGVVGLWFYGLAGSGKSFASIFISSRIENSFIIDGDVVREHVSSDLAYSPEDRVKQISRIYGIGKIAITNKRFPIMSSVFMNEDLFLKCKKENIAVIQIKRPFKQLRLVRDLYLDENNVVGIDLPLPDLDAPVFLNDGTQKFENKLKDYAKSISI